MSLYYLILWNQVDILQKHFKKDHVHMRLWARFYGMDMLLSWSRHGRYGVYDPPCMALTGHLHEMLWPWHTNVNTHFIICNYRNLPFHKSKDKLTLILARACSTPPIWPAMDTWLLFSWPEPRFESGKWMWHLVSSITFLMMAPPLADDVRVLRVRHVPSWASHGYSRYKNSRRYSN